MQTIVVVVAERHLFRPEKLPLPKVPEKAAESSPARLPNESEPTPFWTWFIANPRRPRRI